MHPLYIKNVWNILKINFRLSIRNNILLAVGFLLLIPFIRGTENLDAVHSAECLEQFVTLIGILLVVPLAVPEQNKSIWEVVYTKQISMCMILFLRIVMAFIVMVILSSAFAGSMIIKNCTFSYVSYVAGTVCSELAVGSTGLLVSVMFNSVVAGYLVSMGYFLFNFLGSISDKSVFYLFSLGTGNYQTKIWLFIFSLLIISVTVFYEKNKRY